MAEADCLGDLCGVMAFGKLLAVDDTSDLKICMGLAILFYSNGIEDLPISELADSLTSIVPDLTISEREGTAVKFLVPPHSVSLVPEFCVSLRRLMRLEL